MQAPVCALIDTDLNRQDRAVSPACQGGTVILYPAVRVGVRLCVWYCMYVLQRWGRGERRGTAGNVRASQGVLVALDKKGDAISAPLHAREGKIILYNRALRPIRPPLAKVFHVLDI